MSGAGEREAGELERVVRAGTEALLGRVGRVFSEAPDWVSSVRAVAYELLDFIHEDPDRARAMMLEAPQGNAATQGIREATIATLTLVVDRGREELGDPGSVPASVAQITAGVIYNRVYVALEQGPEAIDEEMVRELMFTAVLPYLGMEAAIAELSMPRPE